MGGHGRRTGQRAGAAALGGRGRREDGEVDGAASDVSITAGSFRTVGDSPFAMTSSVVVSQHFISILLVLLWSELCLFHVPCTQQ